MKKLALLLIIISIPFYAIAAPPKEAGSITRQQKKEIKKAQQAEQKRLGVENAIEILKSGVFFIHTGSPSEVVPGNKEQIAYCDVRRPKLFRIVSIQKDDNSILYEYECYNTRPARKFSVEVFYKSGAVKALNYSGRFQFTTYAHVERLE